MTALEEIRRGNEEAMLWAIKSSNNFLKIMALFAVGYYGTANAQLIEAIKFAKNDMSWDIGWQACEIANAFLDVYGIEKYNGSNSHTLQLIAHWPEVPQD